MTRPIPQLLFALLAVVLVACDDAAPPEDAPRSYAVERTAGGGPVTLTIRLSSAEIGLAEALRLEEEVMAEPGFAAELPEFLPEDFEGMGVTGVEEDPPVREGGRLLLRRRLTLEPERSGKLQVPSLEAWFSREGEETESSVRSDPIEVEVRAIEDASSLDLPSPRPLIAEDEAGSGGPSPWWLALLAPPLAIAAAVMLRKRRRPATPPRPAHEIAWEALRRLVAADLLGRGEIESFFVTLSAILREYIERRFAVRAPERTTEEFLTEAARLPGLAEHREALADFLSVSDRVKFARFTPGEDATQEAFRCAREFIEATRQREEGRDG